MFSVKVTQALSRPIPGTLYKYTLAHRHISESVSVSKPTYFSSYPDAITSNKMASIYK